MKIHWRCLFGAIAKVGALACAFAVVSAGFAVVLKWLAEATAWGDAAVWVSLSAVFLVILIIVVWALYQECVDAQEDSR